MISRLEGCFQFQKGCVPEFEIRVRQNPQCPFSNVLLTAKGGDEDARINERARDTLAPAAAALGDKLLDLLYGQRFGSRRKRFLAKDPQPHA
jgi:hypothetical protein